MINKIIANYLAGGKRLVIPQFGAFIHKEGDGTVVFVPFLKKDDGVLVDLLRKEYGLDEADARGIITEYIAQIGAGVAERGSFLIEGVGNLKLDANGIYFLEYHPGAESGTTAQTASTASSSLGRVTTSGTASVPASETRPAVAAPAVATPVGDTASGAFPSEKASAQERISDTSMPASGSASGRNMIREAYYGKPAGTPLTGEARYTSPQNGSPVQGGARPVVPPRPAAPQRPVAPSTPAAQGVPRSSAPSNPAGNAGTTRPASSGTMGTPVGARPVSSGSAAPMGGRPTPPTSGTAPAGAARPVAPSAQPGRPGYPQRPGTVAAGAGMSQSEAASSAARGTSGYASMPQRPAAYGQPRSEAYGGAPGRGGAGQPPLGAECRNGAGNRPPMGNRPGGAMPPRPVRSQAGKSDKFMIIAILAAVVALASIVYGVLSSSDGPMIDPMEMPVHHNPAQDSLSTGSDSTGSVVTPAAQTPATK